MDTQQTFTIDQSNYSNLLQLYTWYDNMPGFLITSVCFHGDVNDQLYELVNIEQLNSIIAKQKGPDWYFTYFSFDDKTKIFKVVYTNDVEDLEVLIQPAAAI